MKFTQSQIYILIVILFYHLLVLNRLLKRVIYFYSDDSNIITRPDSLNKTPTKDWDFLGMPSGHTEFTTILCLTLIWYRKIPISLGIIVILLIMLQRIVTKRHTLRQVITGFLVGYVYTTIYIITGYSFKSIISMFTISGFLLYLLYLKTPSNNGI